nr:hypothetical protein [uncultured Dysgonomonas sp.]
MAKYTEQLGKKIADAIEQDEYTLGEICAMYSISLKTIIIHRSCYFCYLF